MKLKFAVSALLFALPLAAQNCPVKIDQVKWNVHAENVRSQEGVNFLSNWEQMSIHEVNNSGKDVDALRIGGNLTSVMGDQYTPTIAPAVNTQTLKSDKKAWRDVLVKPVMKKSRVKVWIDEVKFKDGTDWKDDGSHACVSEELLLP